MFILDMVWRLNMFLFWLMLTVAQPIVVKLNMGPKVEMQFMQAMYSSAYMWNAPLGQIPAIILEKLRKQAVISICVFTVLTIIWR